MEKSGSSIFDENEEMLNLLPSHLRQSVVLMGIGQEMAWRTEDILQVVDCLAMRKWAVYGLDLMDVVEERPMFIVASNYEIDKSVGWDSYVRLCAENAKIFIQKFAVTSESLFIPTFGKQFFE